MFLFATRVGVPLWVCAVLLLGGVLVKENASLVNFKKSGMKLQRAQGDILDFTPLNKICY